MSAVRGRVRGGHVETETALPEGTEVIVLSASTAEPFDLDDDQLSELETRIAQAARGETEPADEVLARLRRRR